LLDLGVGAFDDEHLPAFTAHYVAPEMARAHLAQCAGEKPCPVDGKADVFALALTLVDALAPGARELSPSAGSASALARRSEHGVSLPKLASLADVQPALERWLCVDPDGRPSARELVSELSVLTRREERRRERRRLALRLGPFLGLVLVVAGALAFQLRSERVRSRVKDVRIEQQAAEIDQAREAIDALSDEQRARAELVEQTRRENGVLEARLAREQTRKQALERALESEQRNSRELRHGLESAGERAVALEGELRALELELTQLRSERENMGEELLRASGTRRALSAENERVRSEHARLTGELQTAHAERASLIERIRALEASESALASELAKLRDSTSARAEPRM
jgi:predicted  nucleic acid-binding Zn-ribbon protein